MNSLAIMFILTFALAVYFLPSIIAIKRHSNVAFVLIINTCFGWTFIGWISALIGACAQRVYLEAPQVNNIFVNTPVAHPGPGWYANPYGPGGRYWDGISWTEHVQISA